MPRRCLFVCLALLLATTVVAEAPVDWNRIDWRLDRALLVSRYLFHDRQPDDPWQEYLVTLYDGIAPSAADIDGFLALPADTRARRHDRGVSSLGQARLAVLDRALDLRRDVEENRVNYVGDIMWETPGFGEAVTQALRRLEAALAQDPLLAEAWYHLAYFRGLVGDLLRADRAHEGFFAAWPHLTAARQEALQFYREQAILDHAWNLRDTGRYDDCLAWIDTHRKELSREAESPAVAPYVEALLVAALVHAERGETAPALAYLPYLPLMELPSRTGAPNQTYVHQFNQRLAYYQQKIQSSGAPGGGTPVHNIRPEYQTTVSDNLAREHRSSSYLRKWVKAWLSLRRGHDRSTVLRDMGRLELELEFQPRLAWRWWQDQGLIYEELGEIDPAQVCWARAAVYRPYFIYHPTGQGHGLSRVHGLAGTGQPYFLAYGTFFTAGSLWSYAANAALASEVEDAPREQAVLRENALSRLDACIRRDLSANGARAIRGRLFFLAEEYETAEADLSVAWRQLEAVGQAPSDVALMLGLCRFNRHDWNGARPWLQTFVLCEPEAHVGWQTLGLVQSFLDEPELALESLDRAVALAPDNATYLYNRGLLHYRSGERESARRDFTRAQELWPENAQIGQMVQVVEEPTQYSLEMTVAPVRMDLPDDQRQRLAAQLREGTNGSPVGDLSDLVTQDPEARAQILAHLQAQYEADPGPLTRLKLAQSAMIANQPELTRRTLAPYWPRDLTPTERRLLLHADRQLGDPGRAAEIAGGLDWPGHTEDVELLVLAAVMLMDHDRRDQARGLVDRALEIQPGNSILQEMRRSLAGAP